MREKEYERTCVREKGMMKGRVDEEKKKKKEKLEE